MKGLSNRPAIEESIEFIHRYETNFLNATKCNMVIIIKINNYKAEVDSESMKFLETRP